jgi:predicted nucleic acid-binding protein
MGLVLDTSIPIASDRRKENLASLMGRIVFAFGKIDLALSTVSVVEFTHGIYRANSPQEAHRRIFYSDELVRNIQIVPVSLEIAQLAGRIEGEQAARGISIGFEDLLIGATALHLGYDVLTLNLRHFQLIPGLTLHTL